MEEDKRFPDRPAVTFHLANGDDALTDSSNNGSRNHNEHDDESYGDWETERYVLVPFPHPL